MTYSDLIIQELEKEDLQLQQDIIELQIIMGLR